MKRIAIALLFILIAATSQAVTVMDIQTGGVTLNDPVQVFNLTVTAVNYNGVFAAEAPYGPYNHIWIYTGSTPLAVEGDLIDVVGIYTEYYDFSEIDAGTGTVTVVGTNAVPAPLVVPAALLAADGEPYESCLITIPDMMTVDSIGSYGEWTATTADPVTITFDDYWFDDTTVMLDDCYTSVTGVLVYSFGLYKMEAFADGISYCPVAVEESSFGNVKSLYR